MSIQRQRMIWFEITKRRKIKEQEELSINKNTLPPTQPSNIQNNENEEENASER